MNASTIPFATTITALTAAVMVTGCCGPKHEGSPSTATTTTYSSTTTPAPEAVTGNEWSVPLYSEGIVVGKREVESGNVRLRKVVHTENATQPVELRRETVVIDRQTYDKGQQGAAGQTNELGMAFQEKEISIGVKREEPVVELQPYISGRITAQKRIQTEHQNVSRQVRSEDVEVIKSGNTQDITVSERVHATEAAGAPGTTQTGTTDSKDQKSTPAEPTEEPK